MLAIGGRRHFGLNGVGDIIPPQIAERGVGHRPDAVAVPNVKGGRRDAVEKIKVKHRGAIIAVVRMVIRLGGVIARTEAESAPAMHGAVTCDGLVARAGGSPLQLECVCPQRIGEPAECDRLIQTVGAVGKSSPHAICAQNIGGNDECGIIGRDDKRAVVIRAVGDNGPRRETKALIRPVGPVEVGGGAELVVAGLVISDELRGGRPGEHDGGGRNGGPAKQVNVGQD